MERSRRAGASVKLDKFAALKAARQGQARSKQWKDTEDDDLYDEVDENQYKNIVKGRLQEDDFVIDDDGGGYADNGMDEWDGPDGAGGKPMDEDSDEDERRYKKKTKATKVVKSDKPKASMPKEDSDAVATTSAYRRAVAPEREADFMSSIFSALDANKDIPKPKTSRTAPQQRRKRKSSPVLDTSSDFEMHGLDLGPGPVSKWVVHGKSEPSSDATIGSSPTRQPKRARVDAETEVKVAQQVSKLKVEVPEDDTEFDDIEPMDLSAYDDMNVDGKPVVQAKLEQKQPTYSRPAETTKKEENGTPAWLEFHSKLLSHSASADVEDTLGNSNTALPNSTVVEALEDDGSLHFFWLDYVEMDGKLYFTGKVLDKSASGKDKYVSCCLKVGGIERNLYVMPREKRVENGHVTDVTPSREDVYADFDEIRKGAKIKSFGGKWVKRRYAFGTEGIPEGESDWLKIIYGFNEKSLPTELSSPNIARILGAQTSAFEIFVLKRKIMGPCWLRIQSPEIQHNGNSWCKMEASVKDPKNVNPFSDTADNAPRDVPPLTIMSLSIRSVVNHKLATREIVTASIRVWENNKIDDPTPPEHLMSTSHTIVRPLGQYPPGFEKRARSEKAKMIPAPSERALLGNLLGLIQRYDPDVVVGHGFVDNHFDVIIQRLKDQKIEHWSRIGRFRRSKPPIIGRQGTNIKYLAGRLVCDLTSDSAKGMIASTTWSLTEMCSTQLKQGREDIDPDDTPVYLDGTVTKPDAMLHFVKHCEMDTFFQMAIACKVQILPLTRQLTNLAGNSWHKTLTGGRSERNEYILLHEFHRLKYVCPDKFWGKRDAAAAALAEAEEADGELGSSTKGKGKNKKSKDKYKGGLVLEPKRRLWDTYILVMDYNSLYPSIIQEYNIDFTTVTKVDDMDKIPDIPPPDLPQGVLPRLIATLVNRRRQVKGLIKNSKATQAQLLQWDIKQQALKLTANSMYGCLGFTQSRFYARPLAALTTHMGREILMHTKELAETLNLEVIYGDTDSIFLNSNTTDLADALKTANQFKKLVNERYKLLEIDLDGIFQRLLLLQKKKYAALKVDEGGKSSTEVKGLDMKRREFSALCKNVSEYVLKQILSGEPTEVVVESIHDYLANVAQEIREGKIPLEDFIINKRLGKNPEDYPDVKSQPHVQVALRQKAKGATPHAGDVIAYIFCLGEDGKASDSAHADHAWHPEEIRRSNGELKIDYDFYIAAQILPAISRLCDPIEGTNETRLAECLGLDPDKYVSTVAPQQERQLGVLDTLIPDAERYKETEPFTVRCNNCSTVTPFQRVPEAQTQILTTAGPRCPSCENLFAPASLELQLEMHIREHISKYYEGWMVCDDRTCGTRTRRMGVNGRTCLRDTCHGTVSFEYTDAKLYNQLMMCSSLFNIERAIIGADKHPQKDVLLGILEKNQDFMQRMTSTVDKHMSRSARHIIALGDLFNFMAL